MAWRVRVSLRRGGTGGVSATVTIPRELYRSLGEPLEVELSPTNTGLVLRPVKPIEVREAGWEEVERARAGLARLKRAATEATGVKANEHVEEAARCHGYPTTVLVLCRENTAYIEYEDGLVEEVRGAYSCGYPGTSPGALARLIAWLAARQHAVDPEAEKAERAVKQGGVDAVIVYNDRRRVEVGVARRPSP